MHSNILIVEFKERGENVFLLIYLKKIIILHPPENLKLIQMVK